MEWIIVLAIILVILIFLIANLKVVPQAHVYVIERIGAYHATWETGLHFLVPFVDRVAKKVSLKENVVDFPPQPVITKDNVTMQIDTVVFYLVSDAKLFTYGIDRPISAIENLTATTLRNIIGDLDLDQTLMKTAVIRESAAIRRSLIEKPWRKHWKSEAQNRRQLPKRTRRSSSAASAGGHRQRAWSGRCWICSTA